MATIGNLVVNVLGDVSGLRDGLGEAGKLVGGFGSGLRKIGGMAVTALGGAVVAGATTAGAAIAGAAIGGVKAFSDFEAGMNEVFTLLPGISSDAMGKMNADVLAFSKEMSVLPENVIPALYQALSAGVPADNVFEFLKQGQMAAKGGVTDLTTAIDGITSVVNAYGKDVLSAGNASDAMFTTVRLGKTTFGEMAGSLYNVIPTAAAAGVEFNSVTAALAAMTSQGTPTAVATTQLRQLLVELSKSGSGAATIFEQLSGETFTEFVASGGDLQGALAMMTQAANDNGKSVSDLFGSVEAGNAALVLTGSGAAAFDAALAEMGNSAGATQAAFEQMNQGGQAAYDKLKATMSATLVEIGGALQGATTPIVQAMIPALDKFGAWFTAVGAPAIKNFVDIMLVKWEEFSAWFKQTGGPAIQEFATNAGNWIGGMVEKMQPYLAQAWLKFNELSTWFKQTGGPAIQEFATNAGNWIRELIERAKPIIDEFSAKWDERAAPAIAKAGEAIQRIASDIGEILSPILGKASGDFDAMDIILAGLEGTLKLVVLAVEAIGLAFEGIAWVFDRVRDAVRTFENLKDQIEQIRDILASGDFNLLGGLSGLGSALGLPGFASGGVVPGAIGEPMLAVVHGGEEITPPGVGGPTGGTTYNITVQANDADGGRRAGDAFVRSLRAQGVLI